LEHNLGVFNCGSLLRCPASLVAVVHRVMLKSKWPCAACGKKRAPQRCECKGESYCGETCQMEAWENHQGRCTVFLHKQLEAKRTEYGHDSGEVAEAMMTLADVIGAQDRYAEAEKMLLDALRIARIIFRGLGFCHPTVAAILFNLGHVLKQQDKLEDAGERLEESYNIYKELYGERDVHIAANLMSLGGMFAMLGKYNDAQEQFEEALDIYRKKHEITADGDPECVMNIATCLYSIGSILAQTKNFVGAMENYTKALEIERSRPPVGLYVNTGDALMYIVDCLLMQDKLDEALIHITEALPILRLVHGQRSAKTAKALMRLGEIYKKQGECVKSLSAFSKAKRYRLRFLEEDNVLVAEANYYIAWVLIDQRKFDLALVLLHPVAEIFRRARGSNHHCVAQAYDKMAQCMQELGDLAGALESAMASHSIYANLGAAHEGDAEIGALRVESLRVSWTTMGMPV
jgi:tetratricopeptide (TPR) repeat protein